MSTRIPIAIAAIVGLLASAWAPAALAGSEMNPEIVDAAGDVSPAAFASNQTLANPIAENMTWYDVTKAWVSLESASDFWLFIKVKDLPDGWGLPPSAPVKPPFARNVSYDGTSLVANFTIAGATYQAVAKLFSPSVGEIMDNYTLWKGGQWAPIQGIYNTTQDWVAMRLPKSAVLGIGDGIALTRFWVGGRFANLTMDYAPNALDAQTGNPDPLALLQKIAAGGQSPKLVQPRYGSDYYFGQYYHGGYGGGGGASPDLALTIQGPSQQKIMRGDSATYGIMVENDAASADTVYFVLNSAPEGWSQQLSESEITLQSGESRSVMLTVAAADAASDPMRSIVNAATSLGGSKSVSMLTLLDSSGTSPGGSGGGATPGPDGSFEPSPAKEKGGSPGFEFVAVLAAIGAYVGTRRRGAT